MLLTEDAQTRPAPSCFLLLFFFPILTSFNFFLPGLPFPPEDSFSFTFICLPFFVLFPQLSSGSRGSGHRVYFFLSKTNYTILFETMVFPGRFSLMTTLSRFFLHAPPSEGFLLRSSPPIRSSRLNLLVNCAVFGKPFSSP